MRQVNKLPLFLNDKNECITIHQYVNIITFSDKSSDIFNLTSTGVNMHIHSITITLRVSS